MTLFHGYIMVDWSAANVSAPENESSNAIWTACWINGKSYPPRYHRTRTDFFDYLTLIMKATKEKGQRLLIGFDFPFGYPFDSYNGLGCSDWKDLWKLINTNIKDDIDNRKNKNNRFEVADGLNTLFESDGPFWGYPETHTYKHLHNQAPQDYGKTLPTEFRHVEKLLEKQPRINPKSVWKLFCGVTVGSQTLMGIPTLQKLKEHKEIDCVVWPFENIDDKDKHVIAEIYPSIWHAENRYPIRDANQVYTVAKNIAYLDETNTLKNLLQAPHIHSKKDDIIKKEGWILGVDKNGNPAQCP